jgi:hypothetical protein
MLPIHRLIVTFGLSLLAGLSGCGGGSGAPATDTAVAEKSTGTGLEKITAPSCTALKTAVYRIINPFEVREPGTGNDRTQTARLDAVSGVLKFGKKDSITMVPVEGSACQFVAGVEADFYVASSGLVVANHTVGDPAKPGHFLSFLFPQQNLTTNDLAGSWNVVRYANDVDSAPMIFKHALATIDTAGNVTYRNCGQSSTAAGCESTGSSMGHFAVAASGGGFDFISSDPHSTYPTKGFAYRSDGNKMAMFILDGGQGFTVATKQFKLPLPGMEEMSGYWDMSIIPNGQTYGDVRDLQFVVTSVDANAKSYTRLRTGDGRVDTIFINRPNTGEAWRPASVVALPGGGTADLREVIFVPLGQMGLGFYSSPTNTPETNGYLGVSVKKP